MAKKKRARKAVPVKRKKSATTRLVRKLPARGPDGRFRPKKTATPPKRIARKRAKRPKPQSSYAKKFAKFGGGGAVRSQARIRELEEGLRVMKEKGVEWVRRDGAPAVSSTMLRHIPGANDLVRDLERVAGFTGDQYLRAIDELARHRGIDVKSAYKMLRKGYEGPFSPSFRRIARQIAQRYAVSLREVYTLWFSP